METKRNILFRTSFFLGILGASCAIKPKETSIEILSLDKKKQQISIIPYHYKAKEFCKNSLDHTKKQFRDIYNTIDSQNAQKAPWIHDLDKYKVSDCNFFAKRHKILFAIDNFYSYHTSKIGLILPDQFSGEPQFELVLNTMKSQLNQLGYPSEKSLIILRVPKSKEAAKTALINLTLEQRVSIIMGGLHSSHGDALREVSDLLSTPSLIINNRSELGILPQSWRVFPPIKNLAFKLIEGLRKQNIQRLIVVYPEDSNPELLEHLKSNTKDFYPMELVTYKPNHVDSILNAAKTTVSSTSNSTKTGVLILDNFRMARHLINMISSSKNNKNILFAGNQQWRSKALVSPREESLQGALFVDFVGKYSDLPFSIASSQVSGHDNYFTDFESSSKVDYQVLGHRLGSLASMALESRTPRHLASFELAHATNRWDNYFKPGEPAFNERRESNWPVFLFRIEDESIVEEP